MERKVLFIDKNELHAHFEKNERRDIKIVTPSTLTDELAKKLISRGKQVKKEVPLKSSCWVHSGNDEPNNICESQDFAINSIVPINLKGPISISFANKGSIEDFHYHKMHWEVYFSEHKLSTWYRLSNEDTILSKTLEDGGAILFAPGVIHKMEIYGLTIVVEVPSILSDREISN